MKPSPEEAFWIRLRCARMSVIFLTKLERLKINPKIQAELDAEEASGMAEYRWKRHRMEKHLPPWP